MTWIYEWAWWIAGMILLVAVFTDVKKRIIPDWLLGIGGIVFLLLHLFHPQQLGMYHLSAVAFFLGLWLLAILSKGGVGGGDIKLFSLLGLALGWEPTLWIFIFSHFIGGGWVLLLYVYRKLGKKHSLEKGDSLPFAPFILAGFIITYLFYV